MRKEKWLQLEKDWASGKSELEDIVTEPHPEIVKRKKEGKPEMGVLRDSDSRWYMREEAGGLILGPYEDGAPCCYVDGPSKDSEYELFSRTTS